MSLDPSIVEVMLAAIAALQAYMVQERRRDRRELERVVRSIVQEEVAPPAQLMRGLQELSDSHHQ